MTDSHSDSARFVTAYNRSARVEKDLGNSLVVRWQDNGTQGIVPTEATE